MKANQDRAKFSIIEEFVEKQVKMASDPVFGEIQDKQGPGKSKCQASKTIRGNSFATNVALSVPSKKDNSASLQERDSSAFKSKGKCLFCSNQHPFQRCFVLKKDPT